MGDNRLLPESELDIMLVVWDCPEGISAPAIRTRLGRTLTPSAMHSYLKRLEEKGFLSCSRQSKVNVYTPLVSRREYRHAAGRDLLNKLYENSLPRFIAALYDGVPMRQEEVLALARLVEELSKQAEKEERVVSEQE